MKNRVLKKQFQFGIYVLSSVAKALEINRQNGNTLWSDAIRREMKTVMVAFDVKGPDAAPPVGHQRIPCHIVLAAKMDGTRKARFVAGGHVMNPPSVMTYASVVS